MSKQKLAFVGNSALTMHNFRIGLLKTMVADGYDVTVIAPKDCNIDMYESNGIRFIPINVDCRGMNPFKDIKLLFQLKKIYQQEKFDFIFHYTIKPVIYGSFASGWLKLSHISVITGLGYTFLRQGCVKRISTTLYKLSLKKAKEIWFLNPDDREVFFTEKIIKKKKNHLLPGEGVDAEKYQPQKKKKNYFSFIFIGRILWDKGVGEYIEAAKTLKKEYPEIRFQLLGALGSENPAAVKPEQMEKWVKKGIVDYLGKTTNVTSYIANSDCVVLPSYREGLSRILLEASSMERVVIASDVTGCKEIVEDGKSGFLCAPQNAQSLLEAMKKMYQLSEKERTAMGKRGREIILEKFDEKIIIEQYRKKLAEYLK